jgi:hypothetical protein
MKSIKIKNIKSPKISAPKVTGKDKPSMKRLCGNRSGK